MKKITTVCLLSLLLTCASANANAGQWMNDVNHSLGLQIYHHDYEEPGVMEQDGMFYGISHSIAYEKDLYVGLETLLAYGRVDYSSEGSGTLNDKDDFCFEIRGMVGHVVFDDGKVKLTPYVGVAYRFLDDDSKYMLTSNNHFGYLRESNYYYSPVGIKMTVEINADWSLEPTVEYDHFWSGTQKSYPGYVSGYDDIENDQNDGYGYRFSVELKKEVRNRTWGLQMFYRHWDIDDSETTGDRWGRAWIEPENETAEYGVNLSMQF